MARTGEGAAPGDLQGELVDQLLVPVLACAADGSVVYANGAALRWLARSRDALVEVRVEALFPELAGQAWSKLLGSLASQGAETLETTLRFGDGTQRKVILTAHLTHGHDVAYCTLVATGALDVPCHPALQRFANHAMEHSPEAVYWMRRDGSIAYVNLAATRMLGYSREELIAMNIVDLNPELTEERWAQVWRALSDQSRRTFLSVHRARDGRVIPTQLSASLFEIDGEAYSCAFARDVTEERATGDAHRREHAFLEGLVETAPSMIVVLDADGHIVRCNRSAEHTTGYTSEELHGASWVELLVHEADRSSVRRLLGDSLSGVQARGAVYRIVTKGGDVREISWHDQLLEAMDAHGVGLLAIAQDITEQRDLELRLRQAEKMEAVGQLAGGVAHDFNNQLTGIMGWAEILRLEVPNNPAVIECVDRIELASRRAADLTSQLLAFSRKGKFVARPVDLHVVVQEVAAILARSIDKRIAVVLDLQAHDPHTSGDPTQLGNAILNLALNARDAMPNGGVLAIATRPVHIDPSELPDCPCGVTPGDFIELTVSDSGTGIDTETQRRMFEPFFTTKEEGHGTGMGLAAVYGTVKNHRGTIAVTSEVGRGTQIRIRLPRVAPESSDSAGTTPPSLGPLVPLNVMVVDDEESLRELTVRLLRRLGCEVTAFENGFQAIEHYSRATSSVDAVILDLVMPILDGRSTYHALRRINPHVKVILTSGYSLDGAAQALLDEGAAGFVRKPFTLEAIAEAVSRVATPQHSLAPVHNAPATEAR